MAQSAYLQAFSGSATLRKIAPFRPVCPKTGTETGTNLKNTYERMGRADYLFNGTWNRLISGSALHLMHE